MQRRGGAAAIGRRLACLLPVAGLLPCASRSAAAAPGAGLPGLRHAADAAGLLYGSAVQAAHLHEPRHAALAGAVAEECGILVPEGALKWAALRPAPGRFDFSGAEAILGFAAQHGQRVRGHALVWHQALPPWFATAATRDTAGLLLAGHIQTVCGVLAGRLHSWDVVNEAVDADAEGGLRDTIWLQLMGPDYVATAFRLARAADPAAPLFLNEYGLEADGPGTDRKRRATLALLRRLRDGGAPVDGLGLQAHLTAGDRFDTLPDFLAQVQALDVRVAITELDVSDERLPADPVEQRDAAVAAAYAGFLRAALSQRGLVRAVLTWGLSDANSWLQAHWPRPDGQPKRPLPLDADLARKPAWAALRGALRAP